MKKNIIPFCCVFILTAFVNIQPSDKTFKKLFSLQGKWIMKTKRGAIGEEWKKMDDHYLQSRGFFIKGTDTITTERVSLKNTKEGIFYTPTVEDQNNQQPVAFKLTADSNNIFVFENPQHDFPKRIVYKLVSADSIYAYIDGGPSQFHKKSEFFYKRVN